VNYVTELAASLIANEQYEVLLHVVASPNVTDHAA
jgi:hypothetical protein